MDFGTGSVCRSDLPFSQGLFAGFGTSQMKKGDETQF